ARADRFGEGALNECGHLLCDFPMHGLARLRDDYVLLDRSIILHGPNAITVYAYRQKRCLDHRHISHHRLSRHSPSGSFWPTPPLPSVSDERPPGSRWLRRLDAQHASATRPSRVTSNLLLFCSFALLLFCSCLC